MNSDELMSDPMTGQSGGNGGGGGGVPGLPHSSDAVAAAAAAVAAVKTSSAAAWNTKKFREECEMAKGRLSDQKFSIADYPDPLLPRPPHPKLYPRGTTVETEKRLRELIDQVRASSGSA
ncbi:hypothetical protein B0T17DRAFT_331089 [Bombardia bombarda]|uniref:Uncharacterized protein n=1 Tax=Bombardia bombarda TaxID=252184 RepID=A0AA39WMQ5_9PEZI|nr:hypothetical protein B0T17DRAFT_331089 [Bombardia bombarda]